MRFLYIGPFRFPDGDAAASRVLNNARLFRDLGHYVEVLSFGGKYRNEDRISNGEYVYDGVKYSITDDIDTHSWKERLLRYTWPNPNARKIIRKTIHKYDVVITYNTSLQMNLFLQRVCKKHHKKLILDLTEWTDAKETPGGKWLPVYWMNEWNMRVVQKRFKNIIPISHYLNNYYRDSFNLIIPPLISIQDEKWNVFTVINNPILVSFKGVRFIYAGRPDKKDLLENLIAAMLRVLKETDRIQLVVAGVSSEQATVYCSEEVLKKYSESFVFLGRIPQYIVPSYYHISDFSVIIREFSRKNMAGFPTKMAESMASGCPVFINETSDLGMYAKDGQNAIIVKDYSVDRIEEGLHRILNLSKKQIDEMKAVSRSVGETNFDYRAYIKNAEEFINNLR